MEWFDVPKYSNVSECINETMMLYKKSNLKIKGIELAMLDFKRFVIQAGYDSLFKMTSDKQTAPVYVSGIPIIGNEVILTGNMGVIQDATND